MSSADYAQLLRTLCLDEDKLYPLGNHPPSAIEGIIECRGVLGADFLRNFTVSLDFVAETLVLER
jgi:hypothetical protein